MKIKFLFSLLFVGLTYAQETLPLANLNDFKPQAGNWQIVGGVVMNPNIDEHSTETLQPTTKKRKRKSKEVIQPKAVTVTPGNGILLNQNSSDKKDALITTWEHGDIILELEVMLPKGSNSGIYLQGRYEVQLFDSYGVQRPKMSDIGGIYRNWETKPELIFSGIPPLTNAAKAPGLWQTLRINFQAPRFNTKGEKIANAKFISVTLNGVDVQTNVEVSNYTGGPIANNEVAKGPLMIQGDHGAVAFRNIKYKTIEPLNIFVNALTYETYKGEFKGLEDLNGAPVVLKGTTKLVDVNLTNEEDEYGIIFNGVITLPKTDTYNFTVDYTGGIALSIDDEVVISVNSSDDESQKTANLNLNAGEHQFKLTNIKSAGWRNPKLGLEVSNALSYPVILNYFESNSKRATYAAPIFVQPDAKPKLLRAFVDFKGETRLSHTIGVGLPSGLNFVYDLHAGTLSGVWRGNFVDATPMWHDRGNGSFTPRGAVQWLFLNQSIDQLSDLKMEFPKTGALPEFVQQGYRIDDVTKLPVFKHEYKGVTIENSIVPNAENTSFINQLNFSKTGLTNWYCKIAEGDVINVASNLYAINHQQFYIKINSGQQPIIRTVNGISELIIPVDGSAITYEIIW